MTRVIRVMFGFLDFFLLAFCYCCGGGGGPEAATWAKVTLRAFRRGVVSVGG